MYFSSSSSLIVILFQLYFATLLFTSISSLQTPKHYVVYMGSPIEGDDVHNVEASYLQMLDSVLPREASDERRKGVHYYKHAFRGFSAMLTEEEAAVFSGWDKVVSVFEATMLQLHTTRSWDFLDSLSGLASPVPIYNNINGSSDLIIGVLDSGIWPESPSFSDKGFGEIPLKWNGTCMEGPGFTKSNCNRKLIGARYYAVTGSTSARDLDGHGTHTASTAAGAYVEGANFRGLAQGTAKGGQPGSRIAIYKVCEGEGCSDAAILKAMDDAINDGVDLISISIGSSNKTKQDYLSDPIAIGALHAELNGIMVIASAGNEGPDAFTIDNMAPWMLTVAASNMDREFQSSVILGSDMVLQGVGIHSSNGTRSYPLVYSRNVTAASTSLEDAMNCLPGSLDPTKVAGKVVVCVMSNDPNVKKGNTILSVHDAGARGLILIMQKEKIDEIPTGSFPYSEVDMTDGDKILEYILHAENSTVTIEQTIEVKLSKPAPVVAYFSSRGPGSLTGNILKPDIMAPGVSILAAVPQLNTANPSTPAYGFLSGTSMACPHVTGAAAFVKALRPSWTSSMIKSALMTTAILYDNTRKAVTNTSGLTSTPHETGAGEINPQRAVDPGLVFETTPQDYLLFLCYYYSQDIIGKLSAKTNTRCPQKASKDLISTINYPSISIENLLPGQPYCKEIERTVTNVGPKKDVTYVAHIEAPEGLVVEVAPKILVFTENLSKISFKVGFCGKESALKEYHHGSLEWSDGYHLVRSVFSVNIS